MLKFGMLLLEQSRSENTKLSAAGRTGRNNLERRCNVKGNLGLIIFGVIAIIVSLVMFTVAVEQLDTVISTADSTANEMAGLVDIMGVYGILFWVVISGAGLMMLGFGTYGVIKSRRSSGGKRRALRRGA